MAAAIEAVGVVKRFGRVRALDGLDLRVAEGEVHGFLGPNGAGKSTTIRVLLGAIRAGGTARVLGRDAWRDAVAVHRDVASVPGDVTLWPGLSGGETIDLLTRLRGGADPRLRAELIEAFRLDPRRRARTYSKGNRQKVALIAAFARRARLYVLDEPTSGLDPIMETVFQDQVRRVRSEGATVLLSSHVLAEVEQLCDRVTIIRNGRTVETGTLADLRHLTRTGFRIDADIDPAVLAAVPGVHDVRPDDGRLRFDVDGAALDDALAALARARVRSLVAAPPSLEDLFLRHYDAPAGEQR